METGFMGNISEAGEDVFSLTLHLRGIPLSYPGSADCNHVPGRVARQEKKCIIKNEQGERK
jgi:hypothetical protein